MPEAVSSSGNPPIDDNILSNFLPEYYKRLFPIYNMCKWLGYNEGK